MITEQDLIEAITECQGTRNPDSKLCIKLAAYYTIYENMFGRKATEGKDTGYAGEYSYDAEPTPEPIYSPEYESESEFGQLVKEKDLAEVLTVVDELMETLRIMQPRLYDAFIRKIAAL